MAKKDPYQQIMSNIDWNRIVLTIIPVLQPILIFGAWIAFAKMDERADAVSKIIALAEPLPTIDLNVPQVIVLASLYHSTAEALDSTVRPNGEALDEFVSTFKERFTGDWMDPDIAKPKEDESWQQFLERRLKETGLFG